jgi:hypothetical protein
VRRFTGIALRLLGPLLLVLVLLRLEDADQVLAAFSSADLRWVLGASALNLITVYLKVVRWQVCLRTRGVIYPLRRAMSAFLASLYVGMITPGRVGDVLRVQYLHHDAGVRYAEGLATVATDRIYDLVVLAGFVVVALVRFSSVLGGQLAYVAWTATALSVLAPLALLVPGVAERALALLWKVVPTSLLAKGRDAEQADPRDLFLTSVRTQARYASSRAIPLTVGAFAINYLQGWMLARAVGMNISIADVTSLLAVASLLGLLPISVSGVGVRELFFAIVFPSLGLRADQGVTFGLLVFAALYLVVLGVGFVGWQIAPPPTGKRATNETG